MLNRSSFDQACKLLVDKYADAPSSLQTDPMSGWSWHEHSSVPNLGYLHRTARIPRRQSSQLELVNELEEPLEEFQDDATSHAGPDPSDLLIMNQYIVYSATFQVPAFYFTLHHSSGSPLSLGDLTQSSAFHHSALVGTESEADFALRTSDAPFPMLSQGDHPTLGTPAWYFHPCETAACLTELLTETNQSDRNESQRMVKLLEMWIMFIGTIVNLRF